MILYRHFKIKALHLGLSHFTARIVASSKKSNPTVESSDENSADLEIAAKDHLLRAPPHTGAGSDHQEIEQTRNESRMIDSQIF